MIYIIIIIRLEFSVTEIAVLILGWRLTKYVLYQIENIKRFWNH